MKEALAQMKKELGPDAVILKSGTVKKDGMLDFMGRETVEILAAVDSGSPAVTAPAEPPPGAQPAPPAHFPPPSPAYKADMGKMQLSMLQSELSELRQNIVQVGNFLKYRSVPSLPKNLQLVMKQLLDNEVDEDLARSLVESTHDELKGADYDDLRLIVSLLLKKIGGMIRVARAPSAVLDRPRVITLVGPTGVGKTTTIAKLATNQKLLDKKRVALISVDTFRIGAVDQLRTFANIAGIPLTVVYKPGDVQTAIRGYRDMDVIYVDTTGRSQRDTSRIGELQKFIAMMNPDETHLVLSVTSRVKNLIDITERFSITNYNRLLLTKLDETISLGVILNLVSRIKTPVSFLTGGQNVPEDIEKATVAKIARMIVRRKSN